MFLALVLILILLPQFCKEDSTLAMTKLLLLNLRLVLLLQALFLVCIPLKLFHTSNCDTFTMHMLLATLIQILQMLFLFSYLFSASHIQQAFYLFGISNMQNSSHTKMKRNSCLLVQWKSCNYPYFIRFSTQLLEYIKTSNICIHMQSYYLHSNLHA